MIFNEGILSRIPDYNNTKHVEINIDEFANDCIKYFENNLYIIENLVILLKEPYVRNIDAYDPNTNTWDKATYLNSINLDFKVKYKDIIKDKIFLTIVHDNIDTDRRLNSLFSIYNKTKTIYIKAKPIINRALKVNSKNSEAKTFTNECISDINSIMSDIEFACYGTNKISKYSLNESSIFDNVKFI